MKRALLSKTFLLAITLILLVGVVLGNTVMPFADETIEVDNTGSKLVLEVVAIVCYIARIIGVILLVWGVVQLILAFRNEDADSKTKAAMTIVVAVVLFSLSFILTPLVKLILGSNAEIPNVVTKG